MLVTKSEIDEQVLGVNDDLFSAYCLLKRAAKVAATSSDPTVHSCTQELQSLTNATFKTWDKVYTHKLIISRMESTEIFDFVTA